MHSHPSPGWQGMSVTDVTAERDVLAGPAAATGFPLLGLTVGSDGYWSARFWRRHEGAILRHECAKVRVVGSNSYILYHDDKINPAPRRREALRRTYDTWGTKAQGDISRLKIGIVGLGTVGSIVAEAAARIGVGSMVLVDPDIVEEHNLDRLLFATTEDVGNNKVMVAEKAVRSHATSESVAIVALPIAVQDWPAYRAIIDCDIIFSCVDRPAGRDVLNFVAYSHLIPVIDGGVAIETQRDTLHAAHWKAHVVVPGRQCMRCNGQYSTGMVVAELDGSLDNSSYISTLPRDSEIGNQNVFPFALSLASTEINLMLRYLIAPTWWPKVGQQDYQFVLGAFRNQNESCGPACPFPGRVGLGDLVAPHYLEKRETVFLSQPTVTPLLGYWKRFKDMLLRLVRLVS